MRPSGNTTLIKDDIERGRSNYDNLVLCTPVQCLCQIQNCVPKCWVVCGVGVPTCVSVDTVVIRLSPVQSLLGSSVTHIYNSCQPKIVNKELKLDQSSVGMASDA